MKRRTMQKTLALTLAAVTAAGALAGCGGSGDQAKTDSAAAQESGEAKEAESAQEGTAAESAEGAEITPGAGMSAWEPFEENVTLTIPVYDRGQEGVPAIGENYWESYIQENFADAYNITMKFVPITRSDVLTAYSLLAAGNELPTVLMEYDYPKQAQWVSDGYLTPYDMQEFAEIAPTYYQAMIDNGVMDYTNMGGECYFALAKNPYYDTGYSWVTFYRQDWLTQVGYDAYPETWAEEKEMLLKIKEAGICEYPLGGQMVTGAGVDQNYAFRTFPLDELDWAMYGDFGIPALGNEANRKLVKRENEKFNLGLTDPEYYITDAETAKANFINGKSIMYGSYISSNMDWLNSFYQQNPDADVKVKMQVTTEDPEGGTVPAVRSANPFGMMIGFSSQASEDEIKAAMMYMEWMIQEDTLYTMQWGFEGENYTVGEDGIPASVADYSGEHKQGYNNNQDYWCIVKQGREVGTIEDLIRVNSPQGLPKDFTQEIIDNYYNLRKIADEGWAITDCNFSVAIDSVAEYQATLLSLYTEYRDKLTMCTPEEFDALYDELAQDYADAGFAEIAEERKEAFEAGNSTRLAQ
ncbi:MAG: extracellular solute-binding protein [Eubacteriales bacterium]|nr:extracellular solute-binding protein [Eubacteriales bacterium]